MFFPLPSFQLESTFKIVPKELKATFLTYLGNTKLLTDSSCDEHDVSKETNGLFLRSHSESHISDFESEYRTQIKFKHKTNELAGEDLSST